MRKMARGTFPDLDGPPLWPVDTYELKANRLLRPLVQSKKTEFNLWIVGRKI